MTTAYYKSSPVVRTRSVTPMTPDMTKKLPSIADKTVSKRVMHSARGHPEVSHAQSYYNPVRQKVYHRFTTNDWSCSNEANFHLSERERSQAERLRAEAFQKVKTADHRTRVRQSDATKRLSERVLDINYWRNALDEESRSMENEQENLKEHIRVLEAALGHTAKPLLISEECILHREKRIGIDQVQDDVEKKLTKEVDTIKKCQDRMKRLIEKSRIQLKLNRAAQHELEKDAKDKTHAQIIDDRMFQLKNSSPGIAYHPGVEHYDNTVSIPESWARFSQENILRSQKCRSSSARLRGEIDMLLRTCANEMWSQFNTVNNAFNRRIQETIDARNKLQTHLQRTLQEIFEIEKTLAFLKKAIEDKEAPLKVAETRLDERARRINVELCNDPVMKTLQREIIELRENIKELKDRLRLADISHSRLIKAKAVLENDIGVKENSIQIDSKYCMGMRKAFPMDPKVGPIFNMPLSC